MKRLKAKTPILCALMMALFMPLSGCTISKIPNDINNPTFVETLDKSKKEVKDSVALATNIYLLTVEDKAERAKVAQFAHDVANAVDATVGNDEMNLTDLKNLAQKLILDSKVKHKEVVGILLNSVAFAVENKLNTDLTIKADARIVVGKALVKSAAAGVMEATVVFTEP